MDINVSGDPGQNNSFQDYDVQSAGSINPNAKEVNHYHYGSSTPSRMGTYFRDLHKEIENKTTRKIIDDLLFYTTKLDGTKGMEEKLKDGGFGQSFVLRAMRRKEQYAKKALQYDCYPSAQEINLLLFVDIIDAFTIYVEPLIRRQMPLETILKSIHERVVTPIMDKINENGAEDKDLRYTPDHIYGMIFYLTGMCHLNWKDYDNDNV